jgi:hypothetical protein
MSEIEVLARRLLRRMRDGARLVRHGELWVIEKVRGPKTPWPDSLVALLRRRDFLCEDGGGLAIAPGGQAWLQSEQDISNDHTVLDTRRIKDERGRDCFVVVNTAESPLSLLSRRGLITTVQFEAGEKLRRDFTIAQLSPRMGVDYAAPVVRGGYREGLTETALAARQRFNRAMAAAGPGLSDVLFDVCCVLKGLDHSEKARGWPRASGRIVLALALDRLAAHYGMTAATGARMRSWTMEEAR